MSNPTSDGVETSVAGRLASPLFRERALLAYQRGEDLSGLLDVAPISNWILLGTLSAMVLSATVLACVCKVEVTSRGRGILAGENRSYELNAHVSGRVSSVWVQAGSWVEADQTLMTVELPNTLADLTEAEELFRNAQARVTEVETRMQDRLRETLRLLDAQLLWIDRRHTVEQASLHALRKRRSTYDALQARGAVSDELVEHLDEELRATEQRYMGTEEQAAQTRIQISARKREFEAELAQRKGDQTQAESRRDALARLSRQGAVVAPRAGRVDALLVRPGELAQLGAPLLRISPRDTSNRVTAFVAERDRAFLRPGSRVRLEIDQLPAAEFGRLTGTVTRVANTLASVVELRRVFGDTVTLPGPSYTVEITVTPNAKNARLFQLARGTMLVDAKFELRSRRLLELVFDPVRRWLE